MRYFVKRTVSADHTVPYSWSANHVENYKQNVHSLINAALPPGVEHPTGYIFNLKALRDFVNNAGKLRDQNNRPISAIYFQHTLQNTGDRVDNRDKGEHENKISLIAFPIAANYTGATKTQINNGGMPVLDRAYSPSTNLKALNFSAITPPYGVQGGSKQQ